MARAPAADEITRRESTGSWLLWVGVLGAPFAWVTQLVVNYSLEEWFACSPGTRTEGEVLGIGVRAFAIGVTTLLTGIALIAGVAAIHCYRRTRTGATNDVAGRVRWLARAGILNSALYLLIILPAFAPPLILDVCGPS